MQTPDRIRTRAVAYGRVQGVFFRARCRDEARRLHLSGWVANRSDGAVEAVFEGSTDHVKSMLEWMRDGPPQAQVERVKVEAEPVEGLEDFRIV